jgi:hypothetical protein
VEVILLCRIVLREDVHFIVDAHSDRGWIDNAIDSLCSEMHAADSGLICRTNLMSGSSGSAT